MSKLSSSSISSSSTANVLCQCGVVVEMKTSWTQSNPGCGFLCCKTSKARGGCGYFQWYDDEMLTQARRVIWGLLKRVKTYELERNRSRKVWMICIVVAG
ncbi:hypothetical protein R3W88_025224 [Solanum pinnatisectum]|uniref:GRF-type domain-containing protein n=1 Tax=Solanum pinnatisectum TaxID=50273 RepID=A0AAV9M2M3_9SOLN|nr:hypothetical protein R3W88_025224 [Solanum pinnatisectum]